MKSRTLFSKIPAFKKDITRFLPLWLIYFVGGCLVMLSVTTAVPGYAARELGELLGPFSIINLVYAGLSAVVLFGDLYQSRMCNALHALPMRRESWFFSHVAAGLAFSIVPNFVGMLFLLPRLGDLWFVGFLWLLGMTLQYLFFFGLAVLAVMLAGSRVAMVAFYGIINFIAPLTDWFLSNVYEPVMFGIQISSEGFIKYCPTVFLSSDTEMFLFDRDYGSITPTFIYWGLGESWGYMAVIAMLGVLFMGLALLLYRKRHLETAGDFIAFKPLTPVFSVVYTLCFGAVFALVGEWINGVYQVFLMVGIVIGYFTGQMLLQRTVRVFRPRVIARAVLFAALVLGSIFAAKMDVLGIVNRVPKKAEIAEVWMNDESIYYYRSQDKQVVLTEEADKETVLAVHRVILKNGDNRNSPSGQRIMLNLTYVLKNGQKISRQYTCALPYAQTEMLQEIFSRPEVVLGDILKDGYDITEIRSVKASDEILPGHLYSGLLEAIVADCEAGNMAQGWNFHEKEAMVQYLSFRIKSPGGVTTNREIRVYESCHNTLQWLEENTSLLKEEQEAK